jgi:hypothetical protein
MWGVRGKSPIGDIKGGLGGGRLFNLKRLEIPGECEHLAIIPRKSFDVTFTNLSRRRVNFSMLMKMNILPAQAPRF